MKLLDSGDYFMLCALAHLYSNGDISYEDAVKYLEGKVDYKVHFGHDGKVYVSDDKEDMFFSTYSYLNKIPYTNYEMSIYEEIQIAHLNRTLTKTK